MKYQYKLEVTEVFAHYKGYEVAIVDMHKKNEGVVRTIYRKYLQFNEHKSKTFNSAMHFYASGYNLELKVGRDELSKPLSSLRLDECDSDGKDVQYGPDDLPIKKPAKTAISKTSASKILATSSCDTLKKDSDLADQMIVSPLAPKAIDARVSPPKDIISANLTVEAARATPVIFRVEPDLAGELASSGEA